MATGTRKGTARISDNFPTEIASFSDFLNAFASVYQDKTAISIFQNDAWNTITFKELEKKSRVTAAQLQEAGLKKGDRVAMLAPSSIEWIIHFFGVLLCGGIVVPFDVKLTEDEIKILVRHCEPKFLICSSSFREVARTLRHVSETPIKVMTLDESQDQGALIQSNFIPVEIFAWDLAVICYTSGTSGAPKGVEIKVETLLFQAQSLAKVTTDFEDDEVMVTILPLNHLYGLSAGIMYCMRLGIELCFVYELTPQAINLCLRERKATLLLAVPLYVKLVMRAIRASVLDQKGKAVAKVIDALISSANSVPSTAYKNLLFSKIRERLGGRLKRFICGGAELELPVYNFFSAINIPVYVGYGLTETGPVIAVNTPVAVRSNSVGLPLPGVEVRIDKESPERNSGEIWTRGPHVTSGYFKDKELTNSVLTDDGWFKTGDIGYIDEGGFLFIKGRQKTLIVLSSGKKVHPEEVEGVISQSEKVRLVCVLGVPRDGTSEEIVTAVVLPTDAEIENAKGNSQALYDSLKADIDRVCAQLSSYKRPAEIAIRTEMFTMTTSLKIKRDIALKDFLASRSKQKR